jgi:tetrahydromethanopterin S-methyltransferase subunit G
VRETAEKVMKASDVVNKKVTKFTVDMLSRVGKPVKLDIG